jgi:IMP dehydrogenase
MKLAEAKTTYTFDDLMLVPQYSEIKSRKQPDVSTQIGKMKLDIPIISAPMNTVTEHAMLKKMSALGGVGVLHRYMSVEDQIQQIVKTPRSNYFIAIGAVGDYLDRAYRLHDTLGAVNFCIDVANGHSKVCIDAVAALRKKIPKANIMAGNVCSRRGAFMLADVGADIIRCGVGGGSMCKTRIVTGHGVPQLSALEECVSVREIFNEVSFVADGGIRNSGDIVKALAIGCDAVMIGGLLAGTDETPGEVYYSAGFSKPYKTYAGMASEEGRKFNGWFTEEDASFIPEGESTQIPCKGPAKNVIDNLVGGLKVGMSYAGALSIQQLQENAEWVKITNSGITEGKPHGVK